MIKYPNPEPVLKEYFDTPDPVDEISTGLCANCEEKVICNWKENNKQYCELYQ